MRSIVGRSREVDLPVFFNGFLDQFEILLKDNRFSFVLRQQGIGCEHVSEVIGQR